MTNKVQSATMRATNAVRILIAGFCLVLTPLAGTYVKLVQVSNTFMFYSILDFFSVSFSPRGLARRASLCSCVLHFVVPMVPGSEFRFKKNHMSVACVNGADKP